MRLIKNKFIAIFILFFFAVSDTFANSAIEFFASNNTKEIDLATAYERLKGKEQIDLENNMIDLMQKNHVEQGKFTPMLGAYKMSSDQNLTADNTDRFEISPQQSLPDEKIFSLAKELAIQLNQESVAVFIPNQSAIGNLTVSFTSRQPTINEIVKLMHDKLPSFYGEAFSIHLANTCGGFDNVKVSEIEWLGSKINLQDIQNAFPQEKINYEYGNAFLVFQNGQKQSL